jgi:mannose-6-phosphate isomerase-like protein (cupin superfamily)
MIITRIDDAVKYAPPKHYDCFSMHLQHKNLGCEAPYWVGCSYYLPGAKAEWDASPLDKIYIVLEGELTVAFDDQAVKLAPMDSIWIGPGENREVRNETNHVAKMLVVMPYPPK